MSAFSKAREEKRMMRQPGSPGFSRLYDEPEVSGEHNPNQSMDFEPEPATSPPDIVTQVTSPVPNERRNIRDYDYGVGSNSSSYVEFLGDSVPCPTCRGLGNIPKEQEGQLVALIPLKDKRLKPRRTYLYVGIAIFLCLSIGGLLTFFMFPRNVTLMSNKPFLPPMNLSINTRQETVHFLIQNSINISNNNYFSVYIKNIKMTSLFRDKLINQTTAPSAVEVKLRSTSMAHVIAKIRFNPDNELDYMAGLCNAEQSWLHRFSMIFQFTVSYGYLGHTEQTSLTTFQTVSCGRDNTTTTTPQTTASTATVPALTIEP